MQQKSLKSKMKVDKIHSDSRGDIFLLFGDTLKEHEEITIFTTKKGYARGGCIHNNNDEYCSVLEGEITYYVGKKTVIYMKMKKGDTIKIPKGTPHYFVATKDCIVMEWGATPKEKLEKHKEFRKMVDDINGRREKEGR